MRPQKQKDKSRKILNRHKESNHSGIDCKYCANYRGSKRGCRAYKCEYKDKKSESAGKSNANRRGGDAK